MEFLLVTFFRFVICDALEEACFIDAQLGIRARGRVLRWCARSIDSPLSCAAQLRGEFSNSVANLNLS